MEEVVSQQKLWELMEAVRVAERAVEAELIRLYPEGAKVRFMITPRQQNWSYGVVVGHKGCRDGILVVRMEGGHVTRASQSQRVSVVPT